MADSKAVFSIWNYADQAVLSGGSWEASMPLSNVQDRLLAVAARSTDVATASTKMDITLDTEHRIQLASLLGHSCSSTARVKWTGYLDAARTELYVDTDWQDMVPAFSPTNQIAPEESNWLSGKPTALQLDRFPRVWFHLLDQSKFLRYWRIEIDDQDNQDGYIDLGRLFLSPIIQPSLNFRYGSTFGWASDTTSTKSKGGVRFYDAADPYRVAGLQLANLPQDEVYSQFLEMKRLLGTDREFFVSLMPQDIQFRHLFSFQANFAQLSRLTWDDFQRASFETFEIQEAL